MAEPKMYVPPDSKTDWPPDPDSRGQSGWPPGDDDPLEKIKAFQKTHKKLLGQAWEHMNNANDIMDSMQSHLSEKQTGTPIPRPKPKGTKY